MEEHETPTPRFSFSRALLVEHPWPFVLDLGVGAALITLFYGIVWVAQYWASGAVPEVAVSLAPARLPEYAVFTCVRLFIAYLLSLGFAIGFGYLAAFSRRAESFLIATLDILQSIPVLSFLPGVMLAMISLFPTRQIGIELGAIVLIFTGMVWNMAYSFYSSLKSIPRELKEACRINRFSRLQIALQLELPFAAIGLVWNSIVSVANGWFTVMICEMFPVGSRSFRLPGLGSYLQTAANAGDGKAMAWGLVTVGIIIVATDQLIWRPAIAWSDKFKFENVETDSPTRSPILDLLRRSNLLAALRERTFVPLSERLYRRLGASEQKRPTAMPDPDQKRSTVATALLGVLLLVAATVLLWRGSLLVRGISLAEYRDLFVGAGATFLRVFCALVLSAAWTIPVGVAIGFNPRLARIVQPFAQIAASFPASGLFPIMIVVLLHGGVGLGFGAVLLMMLATQWYIFFNVIAGAMAIPSDLKEVATLFRFTDIQKWKTLILPGIFPFLVTGLITASGGAWNASIVTEYYHIHNHVISTVGLGAQIEKATDAGQFHILLVATVIMALIVVTVNRVVWRPLNRLAATKYRLD